MVCQAKPFHKRLFGTHPKGNKETFEYVNVGCLVPQGISRNRCYPINWLISNIGKQTARMINPITTPMIRMIKGSMIEVAAVMAV